MMAFSGRYYVRCGVIVQVHPSNDGNSKGHVVCIEAPWKDDREFTWNEKGNCVKLVATSGVPCKLGDWDLDEIVNPQSKFGSLEVVDCEECRRENREKREGKGDSTPVRVVTDTNRLDWLLDYVNTLCTNKMDRRDIDKELSI